MKQCKTKIYKTEVYFNDYRWFGEDSDYVIGFENTSLWFGDDGIIVLSAAYKGFEYLNFRKL